MKTTSEHFNAALKEHTQPSWQQYYFLIAECTVKGFVGRWFYVGPGEGFWEGEVYAMGGSGPVDSGLRLKRRCCDERLYKEVEAGAVSLWRAPKQNYKTIFPEKQIQYEMAAKTKKKVQAVTAQEPADPFWQAKRDIEQAFNLITGMVPEERQGSTDYADAYILFSDSLDAIIEVKDEQIELLEDEIQKLKDEAIDAEEFSDLEDFKNNVEDNSLNGIKPIYWTSDNLLDTQVMEAFGVLLAQGRPLDLLRRLEQLANPAFVHELDEAIELKAMLY